MHIKLFPYNVSEKVKKLQQITNQDFHLQDVIQPESRLKCVAGLLEVLQ